MFSLPQEAKVAEDLTVEGRIRSGKAVLAATRFKIAVCIFLVECILTLTYQIGYYYIVTATGGSLSDCGPPGVQFRLTPFLFSFSGYVRILLISMMAPPGDIKLTRIALMLNVVNVSCFYVLTWVRLTSNLGWHLSLLGECAIQCTLFGLLLVMGQIWAMCCKEAPTMQRYMWQSIRSWLCMEALGCSAHALLQWGECKHSVDVTTLVAALLGCIVALPGQERRLNSCFMQLFAKRSEAHAAAGVAGLVGDCSEQDVLAQATRRFRGVFLAEIAFEEIKNNTPDPALYAKSKATPLHACDAFVSHSWHDAPAAKWAALQRWRHKFLAEYGREPVVWFDKYCIDQNSIDCDLRCLPIFLSGCSRLVVFCGQSYLSRLWCIMEIFTFVHMSRGVDKIEFELLLEEGRESQDAADIEQAFANFNAEECACFVAADKAKMLSIILAAFGSMANFNGQVSDIFDQAQWQKVCSQQSLRLRANEASPA
eukprot:TRINITY_DN6104_c0_g1_i1.p1 TRINITY_DN6104_c0_g1~~TRINITY_DN6104_c0_g1_i1.p1  ORF type:complete len:482 (-),score=78.05 TRINITY_DN6104_c0_g1_i1:223-1668(-)